MSSRSPHDPGPRRVLSIEDALRWMVRDELPKRRDGGRYVSATNPVHPMWQNGLFTRVDNWSREPGLPLALGDVHPDAERIEAAVRALKPEDLDVSGYDIGAGLGLEVNKVRLADVIASAVADLKGWIFAHAKRGDRPDTSDGPACEGVLAATGGKGVVWEEISTQYGEAADGTPLFVTRHATTRMFGDERRDEKKFCKLKWTRDAGDVAEDRARYAL